MQLGGKHTLGIEETVGVSAVVVLPLLVPGNGVGIDGGGGAAGKTSDVMGSVPEVNVATVAPMAAFLAAVLPPSTGWVPVGDRPARALARICGGMGPEFRPMPVAGAEGLGGRVRGWLRTVTTARPPRRRRARERSPVTTRSLTKTSSLNLRATGCGVAVRAAVTWPSRVVTTPALSAWAVAMAGQSVAKSESATNARVTLMLIVSLPQNSKKLLGPDLPHRSYRSTQ